MTSASLESSESREFDEVLDKLEGLNKNDKALQKAWPKFLMELVAVMASELKRMGEDEQSAEMKARRLVAHQANHLGGRMIYLPVADRLKHAYRNMDIYSKYDGGNSRALSEEYKLTQQRICSIIKEQHELHQERVREAS